MQPAGYSQRSLAEKLGMRPGSRVCLLHAPDTYIQTLSATLLRVSWGQALAAGEQYDFIHYFTSERQSLEALFPALKTALAPDGMLWISWPKQSAKIPTDVQEQIVRAIGLAGGLVDVKVAAIDPIWSGLKFVYRLKDR